MGGGCNDVAKAQQYFAEVEDELVSLQELDSFEMLREILDRSRSLQDFPENLMRDENKVHGCQSTVYVYSERHDDCVHFQAYSDAQVIRGYLAILISGLDGLKIDDFLGHARQIVEAFARRTNIAASVTPTRANAFGNIFMLMEQQTAKL